MSRFIGQAFHYLKMGRIPANEFQCSLPRLRMPKLEKTCQRYISVSEQIFASETRFDKAAGVAKQSQSGPGKDLHSTLLNHDTTDNHMFTHDKLWKAERYLSLALLGVLPAAWVIPHPFMDYAVATSLVVHVHWGVEAIVTDYIRPSVFGSVIPRVSIALVYVLSILAAGGLFVFNWTDVGITQAARMLAKI